MRESKGSPRSLLPVPPVDCHCVVVEEGRRGGARIPIVLLLMSDVPTDALHPRTHRRIAPAVWRRNPHGPLFRNQQPEERNGERNGDGLQGPWIVNCSIATFE